MKRGLVKEPGDWSGAVFVTMRCERVRWWRSSRSGRLAIGDETHRRTGEDISHPRLASNRGTRTWAPGLSPPYVQGHYPVSTCIFNKQGGGEVLSISQTNRTGLGIEKPQGLSIRGAFCIAPLARNDRT